MVEKRCLKCNKLLLKTVEIKVNATIEVKCGKCKSINIIKNETQRIK